MSISISSSTPALTPQKASPVEATDAARGAKDVRKEGEADAGSSSSKAASAPQAYTNALGQLTGTTLNVKA